MDEQSDESKEEVKGEGIGESGTEKLVPFVTLYQPRRRTAAICLIASNWPHFTKTETATKQNYLINSTNVHSTMTLALKTSTSTALVMCTFTKTIDCGSMHTQLGYMSAILVFYNALDKTQCPSVCEETPWVC